MMWMGKVLTVTWGVATHPTLPNTDTHTRANTYTLARILIRTHSHHHPKYCKNREIFIDVCEWVIFVFFSFAFALPPFQIVVHLYLYGEYEYSHTDFSVRFSDSICTYIYMHTLPYPSFFLTFPLPPSRTNAISVSHKEYTLYTTYIESSYNEHSNDHGMRCIGHTPVQSQRHTRARKQAIVAQQNT